MSNYHNYSNEVITTKKGYAVSTDESENQTALLTDFLPEKKKQVAVNLKNYGDNNVYHSSFLDESITVYNGAYDMYLHGNNSKTVNLGSIGGNEVRFMNSGKNTAIAGDKGNTFYFSNINAKNTVTAGIGKDKYYMTYGINKITDKGGDNEFNIKDHNSTNTITSGTGNDTYNIGNGVNNITDKGGNNNFILDGGHFYGKYTTGTGNDTFDITVNSDDGNLIINSGAGVDTLKIHNQSDDSYVTTVTADLGNDNDYVVVDYKEGTDDVSFANIKTGKGEDNVTISAGIENVIDTGKDNDIIKIDGGKNNYITSGDGGDTIIVQTPDFVISTPTNVIRAGKGKDNITLGFGINTVYGDADIDTITVTGGVNTIYGGAGKDIITTTDGVNTILADGDAINLDGGNNTVTTTKKGNTITLSGGTNTINLKQGGNKFIQNGSQSVTTLNVVGNNVIEVNDTVEGGSVELNVASGSQTITVSNKGLLYGQLGKGNDVINISSSKVETSKTLYAGAGNDTFNVSKGTTILFGDEGKDTFNISGKAKGIYHGGNDSDTFNFKGGNNFTVYGDNGNDIFNVFETEEETMMYTSEINGGAGNDVFNLKCELAVNMTYNGDEGVDTFNIYKGANTKINGGDGNDIYNLFSSYGNAIITEITGTNIYNVKQGYFGQTEIKDTSLSGKVVFDKNYKLSSSYNVNGDIITTDENTVSLFANYMKNTGKIDGHLYLIFDMENEMSDNLLNDKFIYCQNYEAFSNTYNLGGKNYKLDFDSLKQDLTAWFGEHNSYSGSLDVLTNGTEADKQSLMALFTKDTADCFVKA